MKNSTIVMLFIGALVILGGMTGWGYIQHCKQDSNTTATQGVYFQKTLNLTEYKNVSSGNDLWGTYHRYTRSDRHTETITVYCNQYCSN